MKKRVVITGGGSGGHLWPMLVVADKIKKKYEIIIFSDRNLCNDPISKKENFRSIKIISGKINRYKSLIAYLKNFGNVILFFLGFLQSLFILIFIHPLVIFSKGGYAALPVSLAARLLRIPVIIHESDLTLGLTNRLTLNHATKVALSFPPDNYNLPLEKIVFTGHILRPEIFSNTKEMIEEAKSSLKLNPKLPTILITGGSQGSLAINKIIAKSISELLSFANIIHISGIRDYPWLKQSLPAEESPGRYILESYTSKMIECLMMADLVITRAGSNTLAEIAALKKPSIIIPYQYASANHQYRNAQYFEKNQAGILLDEKKLEKNFLLKEIKKLLSDQKLMQIIGENAFRINLFNGAENIEKLIDQIANNQENRK